MRRYAYIIGFIIVIAGLLLSIGCKPVKNAKSEKVATERADSVSIKETVIKEIKTAITPADSAAIKALVPPCPDGTKITVKDTTVKTGRATVTVGIKKGVLVAKCHCDTAAIQYENELRLREEFKQRLNSQKTEVKEAKEIAVPFIPLWAKVLSIIGAAAIVFTLIKYLK